MVPVTGLTTVLQNNQRVNLGLFAGSMRAVMIGPMAKLIRYSQPGEQALGQLDTQYNSLSNTTYSLPNLQTGAIFDSTYASLGVTFQNAYLLYATKLIGSSNPNCTVSLNTGYDNQIKSSTTALVFADGGSGTHTTPFFGDSGVKVGDIVHIYATVLGAYKELWATVTGFVNDVNAASIGSAAALSTNKTTTAAATVVSQVATTPHNYMQMTASASNWDPTINSGTTTTASDTYTITVAVSGAGGNGGAKVNITSANGDNKSNVPVAAFGTATIVTERGLSVTFTVNNAQPVDPGVPTSTLVTTDGFGNYNPQTWTVAVTGGYTTSVATSGGTYTGTELGATPTYTATVTRGGVFPQVLQTPPTVAATVAATGGGAAGGNLAAGAYYVEYTFVNSSGETTVGSSESAQFTVAAGNIPRVTLPALPVGVTSINLYATQAGGASASEKLYATGIQTLTYDMSVLAPNVTTPPVSNTCVVNTVQSAPIQIPVVDPTGGGSTGGALQAGTYYCKYTYVNGTGETTPSPESAQFTVSAGNIPKLYLPVLPPSATSINVYLTAAGGAAASEKLYSSGTITTSAQPYALLSIAQANNGNVPTSNTMQVIPANVAPLLAIRRTDGVDSAVNVQVLRSGVATAIGALGVTLSFSQTELIKGDGWTVKVTTKSNGPIRTLVLNRGLSTTATPGVASSGLDSASDLNVEFYILASSIGVPQNQVVSPFGLNWSVNTTAGTIVLNSGIKLFDPTSRWKVAGVLTALPVTKVGGSFLSYRQWLQPSTGSPAYGTINNITTISSVAGIVDPDNPLAQALYFALLHTPAAQNIATPNTEANNVGYIQLAGDPTLAATWQAAIDSISGSGAPKAYGLVPLTTDTSIHKLFVTAADSESSPAIGRYKVVWLPSAVTSYTALVNQAVNGTTVTATLAQDPAVSTTAFTVLQATVGQGKFLTRGVKAGDQVRYQFGTDPYGNPTYNTYTVASVDSEDQLHLTTSSATGLAESTAIKVEIWHPASKTDMLNQLLTAAAGYSDGRVRYIWGDICAIGTATYPSYYYAAALAAVRNAVAPHQGISKLQILGFGNDPRAGFFNSAQLTTLSAGGVWVIRQQQLSEGAMLYTQQAVTTSTASLSGSEEEAVSVIDGAAFAYLNTFARLYGTANLGSASMAQLTNDFISITAALKQLQLGNLGALLTDAQLVSLVPHPINLTHAQALIKLTFPYPLNQVELTIGT